MALSFPILLPQLLSDGTTRRAAASARLHQSLADAPARTPPEAPPASRPGARPREPYGWRSLGEAPASKRPSL